MSKYHTWSNPTNIATGLAAGFRLARRAYNSYNVNETQMAYGRKQRKRRRYGSRTKTRFRRRRLGFRGRVYKKLRRINYSLTRKGIRSIEIKYAQGHFFTPNTITGVGAIATLLDPDQTATTAKVTFSAGISKGTARDNRVGNKIFIRNLRFRALLQASQQTNAISETFVTLMLLRVKNAQGATNDIVGGIPYIPNIFEFPANNDVPPAINNQDGGRGAFVNHFKYYNSRWKNDFTILKLRTYKIAKDAGSGDNKRLIKWNIRINKPAHWDDTNNVGDGHIYLYYWQDQTTTGDVAITNGDRPVMYAGWRITYTDV